MVRSVIEEDLKIEGNITSDNGSVEVKGSVVGDVAAQTIVIQPGGAITGALTATKVNIEGKLKGSLTCDALTLAATSRVQADIAAQTMTTENGAKVLGNIKVTGTQ